MVKFRRLQLVGRRRSPLELSGRVEHKEQYEGVGPALRDFALKHPLSVLLAFGGLMGLVFFTVFFAHEQHFPVMRQEEVVGALAATLGLGVLLFVLLAGLLVAPGWIIGMAVEKLDAEYGKKRARLMSIWVGAALFCMLLVSFHAPTWIPGWWLLFSTLSALFSGCSLVRGLRLRRENWVESGVAALWTFGAAAMLLPTILVLVLLLAQGDLPATTDLWLRLLCASVVCAASWFVIGAPAWPVAARLSAPPVALIILFGALDASAVVPKAAMRKLSLGDMQPVLLRVNKGVCDDLNVGWGPGSCQEGGTVCPVRLASLIGSEVLIQALPGVSASQAQAQAQAPAPASAASQAGQHELDRSKRWTFARSELRGYRRLPGEHCPSPAKAAASAANSSN